MRDVFLDEASALASGLAAYRGYAAAVHRQQGVVVLNPGDVPDPGYFAFADGVVTFEDPLAHFLAQRADPAWLRRRPPAQRWEVVIDVPGDRLVDVLARARADGVGKVFVTDDAGANPYDTLPSDPQAELDAAR